MLVSATSSWLMTYLRLFRRHRDTQSPRFPDHDFPGMRTCAAPALQNAALFPSEKCHRDPRMSVLRQEEPFRMRSSVNEERADGFPLSPQRVACSFIQGGSAARPVFVSQ